MRNGFVQASLASLGHAGTPSAEQERRRALNEATKRARGRFYAAECALDTAQRECTRAVRDRPAAEWGPALDAYESAVSVYVKAAAAFPASPRE